MKAANRARTSRRTPVIAVTAGDPCGIGAEVLLNALAFMPRASARLIIIGDHPVFATVAARLHRRLPAWQVVRPGELTIRPSAPLTFLDCGHRQRFILGRTSRAAGAASRGYLDQAIRLWRAGIIDGLVTAPVTKWSIAHTTPTFIGQTEYLARAMKVRDVAMMFVAETLRVVLLTRHVPLKDVSRAINQRLITQTVRLTDKVLRKSFHIRAPRIAVCGVNPHAGEAGRCGKEEARVIRPALRTLRRAGIRCEGPLAADGLFAAPERYDAILCAYHDQGLGPFKLAARDRGCQLSVGLPIVRTSPDHGSALDIAGKGIAHPGSMRYALQLAIQLATHSTR